ncbi:MAG: Gfo/Idh/MocA family oxidoreductase [Flexilinea sp.]|nr:Gfo/Idh/MocA family oxidoreductase [Flexilinea sp.]
MTIGIGIIGCGKIAQVRHIPEYADNPDAELRAFYDLDLPRAKGLAEKYGGKAYENVDDLIADPAIDAVSVCAANNAHAELTIKALQAGKHVLCEKPMAVTLADCEAMVAEARKAGKFLMIGHNQRLAKAHAVAKDLIRSGLIGRIVTFRTTFGHGGPETWSITPGKNVWFFDKKRAAMGAMADLGVHKTDLIQFLTDQRVVKTTARLSTLDKRGADGELIGVDDNAVCIYEMSGGIMGTMTASWTYYGAEDNSTILYGDKGIMRIYDDPDHSIVVKLADGSKIMYDVEQIQTNDNQTKSGVIDLWMNCLTTNTPPEISGESALYAMRAIFASIRSSETGQTVAIPENE